MNEQKPFTALKATELTEDFVLTYRGSFLDTRSEGDWKGGDDSCGNSCSGANF